MDKLRVGILGLGRGITHLKNFLELPEAEVVGACDRFPALRRTMHRRRGIKSARTNRIRRVARAQTRCHYGRQQRQNPS